MKATGIVRRIDDLGRVVIPKEIRRTMRIREGDPLEIFTSSGEVIFKKYSPMGELSEFAGHYAEALAAEVDFPVIICDRDHCIAAAGISKKTVLEHRVTSHLEEIMEGRRIMHFTDDTAKSALEGVHSNISVAVPIVTSGDVSGAVVLLKGESIHPVGESDLKLASVAAAFLGKQIEA